MTASDIVTVLKNASGSWGKNVYFGRPHNFTVLPVVAVYTLSGTDINYGDGKGIQSYKKYFNIDVWTKDRIEDIAEEIQTAMYSLSVSVQQVNYRDFYEDNGVIHMIFEYEIIGG